MFMYCIINNLIGKGIYTWKDGRRYDGEYHNDKKHGYGIYRLAIQNIKQYKFIYYYLKMG